MNADERRLMFSYRRSSAVKKDKREQLREINVLNKVATQKKDECQ